MAFYLLIHGSESLDLSHASRKLTHFLATALLDDDAEVVDIIQGLHAWLKAHPHETIFVSLKVDNGEPTARDVREEMEKVLADTKAFWVEKPSPVSISDWVSGSCRTAHFSTPL
jgi:hypothetical protein